MYNWDYISHIIRDVFDPPDSVINYGYYQDIVTVLRHPEHGIETWGLYGSKTNSESSYVYPWLIDLNDSFFGYNYCKLFMSFDYRPRIKYSDSFNVSLRLAQLLRRGGIVLVVNPGRWARDLGKILTVRSDLVEEMQRFKIFSNEDVRVLQRDCL